MPLPPPPPPEGRFPGALPAVCPDSGTVMIVGAGSLLNRRSALLTLRDDEVLSFRRGRCTHIVRAFNLNQSGMSRMACPETDEVCCLSCVYVDRLVLDGGVTIEGADVVCCVTLFEIPLGAWSRLAQREHLYRFCQVPCYEWHDTERTRPRLGVVFCQMPPAHARDDSVWFSFPVQCQHQLELLHMDGRSCACNGEGSRHALSCRARPMRRYLQYVLHAARSHGSEFLSNLLDFTWLADQRTTAREYLDQNPDIAEQVWSEEKVQPG